MDNKKAAEDLTDYFKTFSGNNLQKELLKAPPSTDDVLAPTTHLIRKRREELDIHKAMEALQEDFAMTLMAQRVRDKELKEREVNLKEYLSNFNTFLQENKLKNGRALKTAVKERELARQKAANLLTLRQELKALTKEREKIAALVEKHEIYPRFLDKVVKAIPGSVALMSRVDSLVQTREELLTSIKQNQECCETARTQLTQYLEQNDDRLLHYNNRLAKLQRILDRVRSETMLWECRWAHIQNSATTKAMLLGTIKMATANLYQTTSKKAQDGWGEVALKDTLKQLDKQRNDTGLEGDHRNAMRVDEEPMQPAEVASLDGPIVATSADPVAVAEVGAVPDGPNAALSDRPFLLSPSMVDYTVTLV
ncbi:coiled-coil domain-containing protein 42-like [Oncorhynchus clarkii lewisi]|uniref:coiled-coil domain-containing protein 42-like n=1 Tax=Oncorhynchus clarkii lewisi TaxID=490388 RepID=UPI0039B96BB2